ncbi:MAG: hypothetical protein HQM15_01800 [Deltaproteobacteria bacterium]|nr:hypothetical protein [Deltaproteobacteria bacterium]
MNMECSSKAVFKKEFFRKLLHLPALFFLLLGNFYLKTSVVLLLLLLLIYSAEYLMRRIFQKETPFLTDLITRLRRSPQFDFGPFFLALSLILLLLFLPMISALCGTLLIVVSDAAAAWAGLSFGTHKIFYSQKKSYVGSFTFFVSAFLCLIFLIGFYPALALSLFGCLLESLPVGQLDNLLVPLGVALFHCLLFYQA